MDLLTTVLLAITASIVGVAGNMIASEFYDRAPSIACWLIERAAARLPDSERERYREEWLAHLRECPGKLGKLCHALGCLFGTKAITAALEKHKSATKNISNRIQSTAADKKRPGSMILSSANLHKALIGTYRVTYKVADKVITIVNVASDESIRESEIVDLVKDAINRRFFASKSESDDS